MKINRLWIKSCQEDQCIPFVPIPLIAYFPQDNSPLTNSHIVSGKKKEKKKEMLVAEAAALASYVGRKRLPDFCVGDPYYFFLLHIE